MVRDMQPPHGRLLGVDLAATAAPHPVALAGARLIGGLAHLAVLVLGAALVLVFAVTLALVLVLTAAVAAAGALAWRLGRLRRTTIRVVSGARIGHSWIAYGWDQRF
jgi:hypothetical protein